MARIRSVKPELRRDLTVAEWPREYRYAWVLLWGYLDDEGRGLDDMRLLVADLFPLDRDVTERKLDAWLSVMASPSQHGGAPLCRYEVSGRRFLHAPKWVKSQRVSHPQESRIPPCPTHEGSRSIPETVPNAAGADPVAFPPSRAPEVLGVKGSRGHGVSDAAEPLVATADGSRILGLFVTRHGPLPRQVKQRIGEQIDTLVADGITERAICRALDEWARKPDAAPGLLPHLVRPDVPEYDVREYLREGM